MSTAGQVDLEIDQGADFAVQLYWTDSQSNPFTVLSPMRMDVRSGVGAVIFTLQTDDSTPDGTDQSISYNSTSGLIQLSLPASVTGTLPEGSFEYDLFVTYQDNEVTRATRLRKLIQGNVYINGRVTRNV